MLKTLFATTALATMIAWGAQAQMEPQTQPDAAQPMEPMAPSAEEAAPESTPPIVPETADSESDMMAPADAGPETDIAQPEAPAAPPEADTEMATPAAPPLDEGWSQVDVATISTDMLMGADIRTYDQESVATVEDVLMTPDGMVEDVVARFGGFLGFGETSVLLGMDEISVVRDADGNVVVLTNLTPEALKERPEYVPEDEQG